MHNPLIEAILETLVLMFQPSIRRVLEQEDGMQVCIKNHYAIVDLMEHRNITDVFNLVEKTLSDSFGKNS